MELNCFGGMDRVLMEKKILRLTGKGKIERERLEI